MPRRLRHSDLSRGCAVYLSEAESSGLALPAPLAIVLNLFCFSPRDASPITSFDDMPLSEPVLRGIYANGFESPSALQQRVIAPMVRGCDMIVISLGGTGKTASCAISILESVDFSLQATQALVLCPTREYAVNVGQLIRNLGQHCVPVGASQTSWCVDAVGPQVVVGTVGGAQNCSDSEAAAKRPTSCC